MAILSALLSYLARQIGRVLQAVFGWSITSLFGQLPSKKQTAVSIALLLSVVWPVFIVGLIVPSAAAWLVAFVPLEKWIGARALRVIWIALAVVTPTIVGALTRWVAPTKRGGWLAAVVHGYPLAIGFSCAFVITVVTVPLVKVVSVWRRWTDQHVYVQPREGRYDAALHELGEACVSAGIIPEVADVPASMALSTKVIRRFARGAVAPMVAENPKMLRGDGVELYLYPADLLLRGVRARAARVRAMMTRTKLERDAYLVASPPAQKVQDEIGTFWETLERNGGRGDERLRELRTEVDEADIPFEDWSMLERILRHAEEDLAHARPAPRESQGDASATAPASLDEKSRSQGTVAHEKSTADLVRDAVAETKQLVRAEAELAKNEVRQELKTTEGAAIGFGVAAASMIECLALLAVALVLALGAAPATALVASLCFLAAAGVAAAIGYALIPKRSLERTRERLTTDVHELKEHAL